MRITGDRQRTWKQTVALLILSAIALSATWWIDWVVFRFGIAWTALAFAMMAVAHALDDPRLLLKTSRGSRSGWAWVMYGPYFLLSEISLWLFRALENRSPFEEIVPNLFLGRKLTTREVNHLRSMMLDRRLAVLDLAAELAENSCLRADSAYRSIPVLDATAPNPTDLTAAVTWIQEQLAEPNISVYVHCALGHGRSATVTAAYLLTVGGSKENSLDVETAIDLIRSKRPGVALNSLQVEALRRYRDLAGDQSRPARVPSSSF